MKLSKLYLVVVMLLMTPLFTQAQEEKDFQAYWIHEDKVKPSMTEAYETVTKDLIQACKEHNVKETKWITMSLSDKSYLYITPIDKLADLDKKAFKTLNEKMGDDKVSKLFNRYNNTYDEHGDYVVYLNKKLSYMPDGITQTIEGQNYRTLYYNHVTPENNKDFIAVIKNIKKAFEKHNSKIHYRVYKTGFGVMGTYYMIAVASKSPLKMEQNGAENWELMKDDLAPLFKDLNKYTWKTYEKKGWMRDDLSFIPSK